MKKCATLKIVECFRDEDCPEGYRCVEGECVPIRPPIEKWPLIAGAAIGGIGILAALLARKR